MEKDKIVIKKGSSSAVFIEHFLSYENIYKKLKIMYNIKRDVKTV